MIVDLFAGPGGWDVAASALGLEVVGIERERSACETRRAAGLGTVEGDVRDYGPADFPEATDAFGSPPCQPFSVGGKGRGRAALDTVLRLADWLAERRPIAEELRGDETRTVLRKNGATWALLNESDDSGLDCPNGAVIEFPGSTPTVVIVAACLAAAAA